MFNFKKPQSSAHKPTSQAAKSKSATPTIIWVGSHASPVYISGK